MGEITIEVGKRAPVEPEYDGVIRYLAHGVCEGTFEKGEDALSLDSLSHTV